MARQHDIRLRRSNTAGAIPTDSNLNLGELAINTADGALYFKKSDGTVITGHDDTILHIDSDASNSGANPKVGILTDSPSAPLTVKSNSVSSQNSGFRLIANATNNPIAVIGEKGNAKGRFHLFSGTTEKVAIHADGSNGFINTTGKFGFGTATPQANVDSVGTIRATDSSVLSSGKGIEVRYFTDSDYGGILSYDRSNSAYKPVRIEGSDAQIALSGSGKFYFTSTGLGIGTASPGQELDIVASDSPHLRLHDTTNDVKASIYAQDANAFYGTTSNHGARFGANNVVGIAIDTSGDVKLDKNNPTLSWDSNQLTLTPSGDVIGVVAIHGTSSYTPRFEVWRDAGSTRDIMLTPNASSYINVSKLGIGDSGDTTPLGDKLHIKSGSAGSISSLINSNHDDVIIEGSGNIGINMFSPAGTNYQYLAFGDTGGANRGYIRYYHGTDQMVLRAGGSDTVYINGGNVGIGTGSPGNKLHVKRDGNATNGIHVENANAGNGARSVVRLLSDAAQFDIYATSSGYNGVTGWADSGVLSTSSNASGGVKVNAQAGGITLQTSTTDRLKVNHNGSITFNGAYTFPTSDGSAGQVLKTDGSGNLSFGADAGGGSASSLTDSDGDTLVQVEESSDEDIIRFDVAGSEVAFINSTTFDIAGRLDAARDIRLRGSDAAPNAGVVRLFTDSNDNLLIDTGNDGSNQFVIDSSGKVGIGTTSPNEELEVAGRVRATTDPTFEAFESTSKRGGLQWNTGSDYLNLFTVGGHISISGNGNNVGIDTTNPAGGKLVVQTASGYGLRLQDNSGSYFRVAHGGATEIEGDVTINAGLRVNNNPVILDTNPAATYGVSEALRIDDSAGTNDRQLQIFEFLNSGARSHRLAFNTNITTTGSAYTYTQGNYGGSSQIEFGNNGEIVFYTNPQDTGGSTTAITPLERFRVNNDGDIRFEGGNLFYDASQNALNFIDNVPAQFGAANDLRISHNGTDSLITNHTGNLKFFQNTTDGDIVFENDDGSGGTKQYMRFDGGADVAVFAVNVKLGDDVSLRLGTNEDLQLLHDGSNSIIQTGGNSTGDLFFKQLKDDADIIFQCDDGSGGVTEYIRLDGSIGITKFAQETRHSDSVRANFGASNDLQIQHDGTDNIIRSTGGSIILRQSVDDGDILIESDNGSGGAATYAMADGSTGEFKLYHYGSPKLATKSDGVSITGNLSVSGDLDIQGTTTTLDTANLQITDKNITLNYGTGNTSSQADGAGITIQDAVDGSNDATLTWNATDDMFMFSHGLRMDNASHLLLERGGELRSLDTGGNVRTIGRVNSSNELEYGWSANAPVKFMGGGSYTERMRIHTNGNVGIGGTTAPAEKLDVYGGNIQVGKATVNGDRYEVKVIGYDASQAYNVSLKTEYDGVYGRAGQIVTNDVARFEINTTQSNASILLHPGTGNVGIGLDSPGYRLEVAEDTDGTADLLMLRNSDATYSQTWAFQSDTSKDLVITGSSGSGGISLVPGTRGLMVTGNASTTGGVTVGDSSADALRFVGILKQGSGSGTTIVNADRYQGNIARNYLSNDFTGTYINASGDYLNIQTGTGYTRIGSANSSYSHFYTDRSKYYFNTGIHVDTGVVTSHNEDLQLQRAGTNKIVVGSSYTDVTNDVRITGAIQRDITGNQKKREYRIASGAGGGSFLLGKIEHNAGADGAVDGILKFAHDYGESAISSSIHFHFAQRSGTARGHWWYEHTDDDAGSDVVKVVLIDDGSGGMFVWAVIGDFGECYIEATWRQCSSVTGSGNLTAGTITSGTTLFDTSDNPTSEMHTGKLYPHSDVYFANNKLILDADADTYIQAPFDDLISFTSSGTAVALLSGSVGFTPSNAGSIPLGSSSVPWSNVYGQVFRAGNGTVSAPSITFDEDADTGLYKTANGSDEQVNITIDGTRRAYFNSAGITSQANVYTGTTSSFRNYAGTWKATTGTTGNGFEFHNSADSTTPLSIASNGIVTATNQFVAGSTSGAHVMLNSTGSIEMVRTTGSADPFIDFKDSASDDFDVRLQMDDNKFIVKTGGEGNIVTSATFRTDGGLELNGQANYLTMHSGDMLKHNTANGYIEFGPANTSHAHIQTDRTNFYFNTELRVNTGVIGSYDEDLYLRRASNSSHQIQISTTQATSTVPIEARGSGDDLRILHAVNTDGDDSWIGLVPKLGSGGYNGISQAGDSGIIFSTDNDATVQAGALVIAPHSNSTLGLRLLESGKLGINEAAPLAILHVKNTHVAAVATNYADAIIEDTDAHLDITSNQAGTWGSAINLKEQPASGTADVWSIARKTTNGDGDGSLNFNFGTNNQHDNTNRVQFKNDGRIDAQGAIESITGGLRGNSSELVQRRVGGWTVPLQTVIYSGYGTNLGDYAYFKAPGNSTSAHGTLIVGDNSLYYGRSSIETGGVTNDAEAPLDESVAFKIDQDGDARFKTRIGIGVFPATNNNANNHDTTEANRVAPLHIRTAASGGAGTQVAQVIENYASDYGTTPLKLAIDFKGQDSNNNENYARLAQVTVNDTDYGVNNEATSHFIMGMTDAGTYNETHMFHARGHFLMGNATAFNPTNQLNTGSFFKPDSNGKFLNISGGSHGSFINLMSDTTTDDDQVGGIYWSRTAGQDDAHKQVAGIDVTAQAYAANNLLEGGNMRFFTKPSGAGVNFARMEIDSNGQVSFMDGSGNADMRWNGTDLILNDNNKLKLGTSSDLEIYHDSNDSYIKDVGTGILFIRGSSGVRIQGDNGENGITLNENASVDLYHDNSLKLSTTSTGVTVTGLLSATTKSFDIEHPTKEGKRLHHGVVEGPEHSVYVRGRTKGSVIQLPDYWTGLVHEDTITVQLTPIGKSSELYVKDIADNKVLVSNDTEYFYYIQAERKDVERFEVEYDE